MVAWPAFGHEEPAEHADELSAAIERDPNNASLYLQRAEEHRSQHEWALGIADLQTATRLDPDLAVADLALAQMMLEAGSPQTALAAVDRFLAGHGDHAGAHLTRARILVRLGSRREAIDEYSRGIELAQRSDHDGKGAQPDDYLERARSLACEQRVDEAIQGLDEGATARGGAITLQFLAIDLEAGRQRWDGALARLAAIEAKANRKETWMARRAEILVHAGRVDEARVVYTSALATIDALPERLRTTTTTTELAGRIRASLANLHAPAPRAHLSGNAGCPSPGAPM